MDALDIGEIIQKLMDAEVAKEYNGNISGFYIPSKHQSILGHKDAMLWHGVLKMSGRDCNENSNCDEKTHFFNLKLVDKDKENS